MGKELELIGNIGDSTLGKQCRDVQGRTAASETEWHNTW